MGDRLTEDDQRQPSPTPYGDIFDEFCPYYIAMGMPYDLYWDGEVGTKTAYRKAYKIRVENEQRSADISNWNMGQYIIAALQAVPINVNGFVPKGTTMKPFPNEPFIEQGLKKKIEEKKLKSEEARRIKEEDQQKVAMAAFQSMISKFNQNIEKRLEEEKNAKRQQAGQ